MTRARRSGRRLAVGSVAPLVALVVVAGCGRPGTSSGGEPPAPWPSVLDGAGAALADRLIERATPPCFEPADEDGLRDWIERRRAALGARLELDVPLDVRSATVQRRIDRGDHRIDVVRLEVFPGLYLPANVYVPHVAATTTVPLVITPTGCGSGTGTAEVQARASGLVGLGLFVVVTEGFCDNGARAATADADPRLGYARQLLGLPGDVTIHLRELLAAARWAPDAYPSIDRGRIGVAGYSYGGQMALYLAQFDPTVASVSVPATALGRPCAGRRLPSDLWLESSPDHGPEFVWSAPLEIENQPANWRPAMIFPRPLHTTTGTRDWGAHPDTIGPAMEYATRLYALAGLRDRVLHRIDRGTHHYGRTRRDDTYRWFERTLAPPDVDRRGRERADLPEGRLRVDLAGTRTLADALRERVERERAARFDALGRPRAGIDNRVRAALRRLNVEPGPERTPERRWRETIGDLSVSGRVLPGEPVDLPVITIEAARPTSAPPALFVTSRGAARDRDRLRALAERHPRVDAVELPGIGELKSDRLLLHTLARYLMHARVSLPERNVALLRDAVRALAAEPVELVACDWATSFYALLVARLEPERVARVSVAGVPDDELATIGALEPIPALLLDGGLFAGLTARELAATLEPKVVGDATDRCGIEATGFIGPPSVYSAERTEAR